MDTTMKPEHVLELGHKNGNELRTTSRVRVWWLTRIKKYEVVATRQTVSMGWFGKLNFSRYWTLVPGNRDSKR